MSCPARTVGLFGASRGYQATRCGIPEPVPGELASRGIGPLSMLPDADRVAAASGRRRRSQLDARHGNAKVDVASGLEELAAQLGQAAIVTSLILPHNRCRPVIRIMLMGIARRRIY